MAMSKQESGKLGAQKSAEIQRKKKEDRVRVYLISPKLCLECSAVISYDKRTNMFCSQSCGARYSNARKDWSVIFTGPVPSGDKLTCRDHSVVRTKKEKNKACLNCGVVSTNMNKFCNTSCQQVFLYNQRILNWQAGNSISKKAVKKYLAELYGYKCSQCDISDWNGKNIVLELEHKDGNSENNLEENLCLICPNCHSQTATYKGKNRGKGRHSRRQRYAAGKSF